MSASIWPGRFDEQVAVVTGAASGLGLAIAQRLSAEGATVWLLDRDEKALERAVASVGSNAHPLALDITDEPSVEAAFARVLSAHGRCDILVNSAGIVGPNNLDITRVPSDGFAQVLDVNLFGTYLMAKHAVVAMRPRNYGRILLIASIAGKEGNAGMCAYSASKAGVIGLVKSVGKELAETGITVNALAPAVIRTAMVEAMEPQQVKYMTDKIPMKRCATLQEVASLACWIVSPEASFNTGFTFDLSGGRAVY
ncbi:MAG TPA: SDR family NAD(P)-dependent oxidoreductase [Steroidobacter sp.]